VDGRACVVDVTAVQALWAVVLALTSVSLGVTAWGARKRARIMRRTGRGTWRLALVPLGNACFCAAVLPMAIGKLAQYEEWIIGLDAAATVLHCFAVASAETALIATLMGILKASMVEVRRSTGLATNVVLKTRFRHIRRALAVIVALSYVTAFVPIALLPHPASIEAITAAHGGGLALTMLVAGVCIAPPFLSALIRNIEGVQRGLQADNVGATNAATLALVARKLRVAWWVAAVGFGAQTCFVAVFATVPVLISLGAYFIPVEYMCLFVAVDISIWVTTTSSSSATSSGSGAAAKPGAGGGAGGDGGDRRASTKTSRTSLVTATSPRGRASLLPPQALLSIDE